MLAVSVIFCLSCATKKNDPLKNTKKFVKESHVSLYKNGAFHVPSTSIYLIPKGPEAIEFVAELAGLRARKSFLRSLKRASESVYIVSEGTKKSWGVSKKIHNATDKVSDKIKKFSKENRTLLLDKSSALAKDISVSSWTFSKDIISEMDAFGEGISGGASKTGDSLSASGSKAGINLIRHSVKFSKEFSKARTANARDGIINATETFIDGYLAVPGRLKKNAINAGDGIPEANPVDIINEHNTWRKDWAGKSADLVGDTTANYSDNAKKSLSKIEEGFVENYKDTGVAFATMKALRWAFQAALWDLTLKPLTKIVSGSVGYIGVNLVAFPVMVVLDEAGSVARIAVDVTWNSAKSVYHLTAPTAAAALGSVFSCFEITAGNLVAGSVGAGGALAGVTGTGLAKTGGLLIKGSGQALGKTVQYVGVPFTAAGVAVGGKAVGVTVDGAGKLSFGALYATGHAAAAASDVFGNIIAGTTLSVGTVVSTAGGAGYGVYQLSKAVAVPAGYELGAGVVLSYDTMAHIGAQSILAVADCSYLVLSLEGPRWVIYAIKGKTGNGDDLVPGAVLDLNKMQKSGETIYNLPVSDGEMKDVVESVHETLPEI